MMQDAKFTAAGRKGEEAIDVDISTIMPGDWLTIITEEGSIRLKRLGNGAYSIVAGTDYHEAAHGEMYGSVAVQGLNVGMIDFKRKRDPKADLEQAAAGEFTGHFSADDARDGGHSER